MVDLSFEGEKDGDEDLLFAALAPYVEPGSWIAVCRDDGAVWRWYFDGRGAARQSGRVIYDASRTPTWQDRPGHAVDLLAEDDAPDGWHYPAAILRVVRRGLTDLHPWFILEGEQLRVTARGLRERYQARTLVPFAKRGDCDDVACWEARDPARVQIIHDFASPGWEQRESLPDFAAGLQRAVEDLLEFDALEPDEPRPGAAPPLTGRPAAWRPPLAAFGCPDVFD